MFKKLRIRLTLFNLMIITLLLLLIAAAAFIGSPTNDTSTVNSNMLQIALSDEIPQHRISNYRNHQGGVVRIQLSNDERIETITSELNLSDSECLALVALALEAPENSGTISLDSEHEYIFLRVILEQTSGPVIVLQEVISTRQSLINFTYRIGPFLLVMLVLIFFASFSITQRALIPIKKTWQRQVDFTADASHELRTPLSVIQTNLECATDNPTKTIAENEQWFDNIKAENKRMIKLVNDLLTLSRSDNSEHIVNKAKFDFDKVLCSTVEAIRPVAEQSGISLQADIQKGLTVSGDSELLNRLVVILLDNAIKYTPASGTVRIFAEQKERRIIVKIADTGLGIGAEHLNKIFERFYRVDSARSSDIEGSGLGLSLAKWIVEEHKGSISVESKEGCGSEFMVVLPC